MFDSSKKFFENYSAMEFYNNFIDIKSQLTFGKVALLPLSAVDGELLVKEV